LDTLSVPVIDECNHRYDADGKVIECFILRRAKADCFRNGSSHNHGTGISASIRSEKRESGHDVSAESWFLISDRIGFGGEALLLSMVKANPASLGRFMNSTSQRRFYPRRDARRSFLIGAHVRWEGQHVRLRRGA
jgi:hypothetical protein